MKKLTEEYKECNIDEENITESTIDDMCDKFNSEKCQKYYTTKMADLPECKDSLTISLAGIDNMMKITYLGLKNNCEKDENNKYCPFNSVEIAKKIKDDMTEEESRKLFDTIKEETCKSKKCSESYINFVTELNNNTNSLMETVSKEGNLSQSELDEMMSTINETVGDDYTGLLEYLKSDKCAAASGAESIIKNINFYLVLSVLSALYFLF